MSFEDTIIKFKNKKIYFIQPGGNHGDYLIYKGAEKIANKNGLDYTNLNYKEFMQGDYPDGSIFYIHGSGGYNSWCSGTPFNILKKAVDISKSHVIQGSSTVELNYDFLKNKFHSSLLMSKASSINFIAREQSSYNILKEILPENIDLIIDKDTALYLNRDDIVQEYGQPDNNYNLRIVRQDPEASFTLTDNLYSSAVLDPAYFCKSFEHWVRIHLAAKTIITNRTHSSILGAILGTPTTIAAGSYHKNKSIWEYSLKAMGVNWTSDEDFKLLLNNEKSIINIAPVFFKKSWKVNKFWNDKYLKIPNE